MTRIAVSCGRFSAKQRLKGQLCLLRIVDFLCHHVSLHKDLDILKKLLWLSCINCIVSEQFKLDYGVPQGSYLGSVEFTVYSSPIFSIINQHGKLGHAYADVHQVYCSFQPDSMDINRESMEQCISGIKTWMQGMKLKFNHSNTEYILIGTTQQLAKCINMAIDIWGNEIHALHCVRNWALILITT